MSRSDVVTIVVDVPEVAALGVNPGDPVEVAFQALPGKPVEGPVTRTAWAIEPQTRTLRVEVDIKNSDRLLRPGLYAYATIVADRRDQVLTLPTTALVRELEKTYCVTVAQGVRIAGKS